MSVECRSHLGFSPVPPVLNDAKRSFPITPHEVLFGGLDPPLVGEHMLERKILEVHLLAFGTHTSEEVLYLLRLGWFRKRTPFESQRGALGLDHCV